MRYRLSFFVLFVLFASLSVSLHAQSLDEILMHFSEKEMEVPLSVRQNMVNAKGNTIPNYDNYKLIIYDKRANFLQIRTPLDVTYEIATWRYSKSGLLVGLCETRCGNSCKSKISFYLPEEDWKEIPADSLMPEFSLSDIFNEKRLSKNYLTVDNVVKDFEVKTQFMLPQSGHNIVVIFTCLDELDKKEYQRIFKYLDGVMLDLVWEKGKFRKTEVYFPAN